MEADALWTNKTAHHAWETRRTGFLHLPQPTPCGQAQEHEPRVSHSHQRHQPAALHWETPQPLLA